MVKPTLTPYQHPSAAFALPLPEDWERLENVEGVALVAVEPARGPWFRPNLVVTIGQLAAGTTVADWQDDTLGLLRQTLDDFLLLDLEDLRIGDLPARRTLAHYTALGEESINAVTMEQWAVAQGELGYTLTASVAALEYLEYADVFSEVAAQLRTDPRVGA